MTRLILLSTVIHRRQLNKLRYIRFEWNFKKSSRHTFLLLLFVISISRKLYTKAYKIIRKFIVPHSFTGKRVVESSVDVRLCTRCIVMIHGRGQRRSENREWKIGEKQLDETSCRDREQTIYGAMTWERTIDLQARIVYDICIYSRGSTLFCFRIYISLE